MRPQATDSPGERYEIRERLGGGGGGSVHVAWDRLLDREVAIKRVPLRPDSQPAWLREAQIAARLRHPGFVTLYEARADDTHGWLVMERLTGLTLGERMKHEHEPLAPEDAAELVLQASRALAHAHAEGVVHGDLKPSNLVLQPDGRLRILDFGVSRRIDPLQTLDDEAGASPSGTLLYMAPEQLEGRRADPCSDIFALGLVLCDLLGEGSAGAARAPLQVAHARLQGREDWMLPASAPPLLAALARDMTARDPARRPSMAAIAERLQAWQSGLRDSAASQAPHAPQSQRTHRLIALVAALLIASLFASSPTGPGDQAAAGQPPTLDSSLRTLESAEALMGAYDEPGNLQRAAALLESMLRERPGQAPAAAALAIAYCLMLADDARDPVWLEKARASAQLALRADDHLARAQAAMAWVVELSGDPAAAERGYRQALTLDPREPYALNGLARLLTRQRRWDEAVRVLDSALAAYPSERVFLDAMGAVRFAQADYAGAEAQFRRSIAAKPTGVYGYANLAGALLHQDRADEALAVLQQGLRVRPHSRLYNNLGTILYDRGRYVEAAEAFERALSSEKGNPNDYVKWANLADALRWVPSRQADARSAYRRALQMLLRDHDIAHERDAEVASRAGLYAARIGDPRSADWIRTALELAPRSPTVLFRAALAETTLGRIDTALGLLERALAHGYPHHLVEAEPELQALRRDIRYHQLMARRPE